MNRFLSQINNSKKPLKDLNHELKKMFPIQVEDYENYLQNNNKIKLDSDRYEIILKRWYLNEEFKNVWHKNTLLCILDGAFLQSKPYAYNYMIKNPMIIEHELHKNQTQYLQKTVHDLKCLSQQGITLHIAE